MHTDIGRPDFKPQIRRLALNFEAVTLNGRLWRKHSILSSLVASTSSFVMSSKWTKTGNPKEPHLIATSDDCSSEIARYPAFFGSGAKNSLIPNTITQYKISSTFDSGRPQPRNSLLLSALLARSRGRHCPWDVISGAVRVTN